ncbi:MAG: FHA domain-containing protein [Planctomycetota bacterium]|nr:FHA domain-containing protein [Planctomycetota bacterium]
MKFLIECEDYSQEFKLPEGSTVIGTGAGSRLLLEFPGVEPRHAQFYWDGSRQVILKSLGAPLFVNGKQTARAPLVAFDEIQIGEVKLTFLRSSAGDERQEEEEEKRTSQGLEASGERIEADVSLNNAPDDSEVGGTPVEALPGPGVHRPKKSKLPQVFGLGVLCLAGVLLFSLTNKNDTENQQKIHQDYERHVRMGFAWLQEDKPAEAKARFRTGLQLMPESRLSRILLGIADIESTRGNCYENYRWTEAEQYFSELQKSTEAPSDMLEFARNRLMFVMTHRIHAEIIAEARQLFDRGDSIQAEEKIRKLPEDSLLLCQYKDWVLECRQDAFNVLLASMTKSSDAQEWDDVLAAGKQAAEINPDSTRLSVMTELAQKSKVARARLSTALELLDTGRRLKATPNDATSVLQQAALQLKNEAGYVSEGTAYQTRSVEVLEEIHQLLELCSAEELVQSAFKLFASGEAQKALDWLNGEKLSPTALGLKNRIAQSLQLEKKAKEYDTSKQYEAARDSWRDLLKLAGEGTAYRLQAQSRLKWYEDNAEAIAGEYWKFAISVVEEHPNRSRALLQAALSWSEDHKESKKALDDLNRKAELQYRLGYTKRGQNVEEARKHFQTAAKFAEENSELAIKAMRELRKLED